jgi:predicted regulator of amino acid metabolism with ACT domain
MKTASAVLRCGLVMPISGMDGCSEGHWEDVRSIIKEALLDSAFVVELVSTSNEIGIIQKRIVQNIYDNEMIIVDVSAKNPNVMFELGLRLAFDKPAIIIKDDQTNYSFDTSPIEHIEYPRDLNYHSIQAFKKKLKEKLVATYSASLVKGYTTFLGHFGTFVVAKLNEKEVGKDDYLIESVSELRKEVQSLASVISSRSDLTSTRGLNNLTANKARPETMSEIEFVRQAIANLKGEIRWAEMIDANSPAFKIILDEYCEKYVPQNIATKLRHRQSIGARLLEAILELQTLD